MDNFDFRPRFSPIIDGAPFRYSVAAYRGKRRVVVAWFIDECAAIDYLSRCRLDHPNIKFDLLRSLF